MRQIFALFGVVLALVPALLYYNTVVDVRASNALREVYVLKNNPGDGGFLGRYVAGDTLEESDLDTIFLTESSAEKMPWAIQKQVDAGGVAVSEVDAFVGRQFTQTVSAGALLQEAFFISDPRREFGMQIATGKQAFSISVDEADSAGGFVEPGSIVDVYAQPVRTDQGRIIGADTPIVSKIRILAVGDHFSSSAYEQAGRPAYRNVTVELSTDQITAVLVAREVAGDQMILSLYNPCATEGSRAFGCPAGN
ncbi:MAG: Flp pilus assembly protein CpaB [Hyphomicrobiales bacterium]